MFKLISIWFKSLSSAKKVLVVIIIALFLALSIQSIRLARSEYLRLKAIEKEYNDSKEAFEESDTKQVEIVDKIKEKALKTGSKNENINKKLKEDEKIIDSDSVTDGDLLDFISKHENQNR